MWTRRTLLSLLLVPLLLFAPAAHAAVTATFYAHELGSRFPHAFVVFEGTLASGERVDGNFGFTAVTAGPAVLWGSVNGEIDVATPDYIENSNAIFSLPVSDAQYRAAYAKMEEWRDREQPTYNLGRANCVHFIGEVAQVFGLTTNAKSKNFRKPRSYLLEVAGLNKSKVALLYRR